MFLIMLNNILHRRLLKNLTSNVHQIESYPIVGVQEIPALWHRYDLDLVPFLKVQVIIPKFKNEAEVNFKIIWRHGFEGIGR